MEWPEFITHLVAASSPKGGHPTLSDIIVRDDGTLYVSQLGVLELVPLPAELIAPGSFDALLRNFMEPRDFVGRTVWEGAWMLNELRFRISLSYHLHGLELVMRLLPFRIPTPEECLLPASVVDSFLRCDYGLILILGSTGSGKSTTMAALMQHMGSQQRKRFITIEDPIEFVFPKTLPSTFTQRQVGSHCESFAKALISALRQLPNVIMVGEIRDSDTAEVSVQAAESGHLVISTMHAETPDQAVQRFLKLIPPERADAVRDTLGRVLKLTLAQKLVRHPIEQRRVPIHEVMVGHEGIAHLIRRGEYHMLRGNIETSKGMGMQTFEQSLDERRASGLL